MKTTQSIEDLAMTLDHWSGLTIGAVALSGRLQGAEKRVATELVENRLELKPKADPGQNLAEYLNERKTTINAIAARLTELGNR